MPNYSEWRGISCTLPRSRRWRATSDEGRALWLGLMLTTDAQQAHLVPEFEGDPENACLGFTSPVPDDKDLQVRLLATSPGAFRGRDARQVGGFAPDPELDEKVLTSAPQASTPTQLPKPPGAAAFIARAATGPEGW